MPHVLKHVFGATAAVACFAVLVSFFSLAGREPRNRIPGQAGGGAGACLVNVLKLLWWNF